MVKKEFVLLFVVFIVLASLFFVFAAATFNAPIQGGNYTTTLEINCTESTLPALLNATIMYNASGGAAQWNEGDTSLVLNSTVNTTDNETYIAAQSISSLTDATTYNISCWFFNGTDPGTVADDIEFAGSVEITIDNTPPNVSTPEGPVTGGNYSGTSLLFNVSITDTTLAVDSVNFTIINFTGDMVFNLTASQQDTSDYWNATLDTTLLADGVYNITIYANDTLDNLNDSIFVENITIDNTPPNVSTVNPINNGNYSLTIVVNISIMDALLDIDTVNITIFNSTGDQNATYTASRQGTSDYWNFSLDTSIFADGRYNITIYANDTVNNLNNSITISDVAFDNSAPAISLSKFSSTDSSLSISLSTSDAFSTGNNGSCSVNRAGASISSLGTLITESGLSCGVSYTYTVTCTDNVGNSASASGTFSTDGCSSSASSGGGGAAGTPTKTYSISEEQYKEGYTKPLAKNEVIKFKVEEKYHNVKVTEITSTTTSITVSSTPQTSTLSVGEEKKFELTGDNYNDLSVKLDSITNNKASLTIKSIYEKVSEPTAPTPSEEKKTPPGQEKKLPEAAGTTWIWIIVIAVVLVIAAVIIWVITKKRQE